MFQKMVAGLAVTAALSASLAGAALAQDDAAARRAPTELKTTVTPNTGVTKGTVIKAVAKGAPAGTEFVCVLSVISMKGGKTLTASNLSSLAAAKTKKSGKAVCKQTYNPWSAEDEEGKVRHCPTTKKDKKAGFKCGVALADKNTIGAQYAGVGFFTPAS